MMKTFPAYHSLFLNRRRIKFQQFIRLGFFISLGGISAAFGADDYATLATTPPELPSTPSTAKTLPLLPLATPSYFRSVYESALRAPLPSLIYNQGGIPAIVPQLEIDPNLAGLLGTYQPTGATVTAQNAFFQSLGENGRSCATCHQPPSGMSVSVQNIRARLLATGGKDPIFAPVDGANCPNLVAATATSGALLGGRFGAGKRSFADAHSLLLNKGLFRIFLPVPIDAEFTVEVVSDPTTCNTDPNYNSVVNASGNRLQIVSVFRRPAISSNLSFKTATLFPAPDGNSGNIMWDGREPTFESQAIDATLGHAQALTPPTPEQVAQIVQFEKGIFSAQLFDLFAWSLNTDGAHGGPVALSAVAPGQLVAQPFDEYVAWSTQALSMRRSIARGENVFNARVFTISNVAGFNNAINNNAVPGTCATCHNVKGGGNDIFPLSQRDIGIGGQSAVFGGPAPAADLPIFRVTCKPGFAPPFNAPTLLTNDPGRALISGKCADLGARTVPTLRGLVSHPPFFSDGSAATVPQLVEVYNKRFGIGLTTMEKTDLVNFLKAL